MESLKKICGHLEDCVLGELGKDKSQVDAKELGEVIDAIKDIKMAIYYASITEAMEDAEYGKDYDERGKLYYSGRRRDSRGRYAYTEPNMDYYTEPDYRMPTENYGNESAEHMRDMDRKQGRMYYTNSGARHMKRYYEHKGVADEGQKMQSLEEDMREISDEITGMVTEMSNTEKTMLRTKLQNLVNKI